MITQQQIDSLKDWINNYLEAHQNDINSEKSVRYRTGSTDQSAVTTYLSAMKKKIENPAETDEQSALNVEATRLTNLIEAMNEYVSYLIEQQEETSAMRKQALSEAPAMTDIPSDAWKPNVDLAKFPFIKDLENTIATREAGYKDLKDFFADAEKTVTELNNVTSIDAQVKKDKLDALTEELLKAKDIYYSQIKVHPDTIKLYAQQPLLRLKWIIEAHDTDYKKVSAFFKGVDKLVTKQSTVLINEGDSSKKLGALASLTNNLDALKKRYCKMEINLSEFKTESNELFTTAKKDEALLDHRNSGLYFLLQSIVNLWNAAFYAGAKTRLFAPESYTMVEELEKTQQNTFGA